MARKRKSPHLRFNGKYFVANFYKPDGKRTMISFGPANGRAESEIYADFHKWLELYKRQPQKVLAFESPYDAIENILNPSIPITVGDFIDQYCSYTSKIKSKSAKGHRYLHYINQVENNIEKGTSISAQMGAT